MKRACQAYQALKSKQAIKERPSHLSLPQFPQTNKKEQEENYIPHLSPSSLPHFSKRSNQAFQLRHQHTSHRERVH